MTTVPYAAATHLLNRTEMKFPC